MLRRIGSAAWWLTVLSFLSWSAARATSAAELKLQKGDSICLIGNALGERLQHHPQWESLLHQRFPSLQLTVRNLCFPGDEPNNRLRSMNFGEPDVHLKHSKADVILCFFGFNESFAGDKGLTAFSADLSGAVKHMLAQNYSGKGSPRIVLVSPIAFEPTGDSHLPDGSQHNARLAKYARAIQTVAEEHKLLFADVFGESLKMFERTDRRLTLNGVHLNDEGYAAFAPIFDKALFGSAGAPSRVDAAVASAVTDKSFHWWHRYRAVNGYSIYGKRGEAGFDGTYRNREVMEREREILDQMTANRDARIWLAAQGSPSTSPVDDSNTLPFIQPKTNVGGPNDKEAKAGKLGSLDYLKSEEQRKLFKLPAGYEVTLFASEEMFPEMVSPVAINFDNRGRMWVATMPSYPQWKPKSKMDDKLLILDDENNDGAADKCTVFAGGLHQPTGFEIGRGGVYVAEQPDILFLKDTDGDDRADVRTRKLFGFDTADSHHGIAAFEWGPDGGLYFQEGTFKQSQVETPYGVQRLGDSGVWRYDPRTEKLEVHSSLAFANPWGHVFDRWGQNFICDASSGYNYWGVTISGEVTYPDKHAGGAMAKGLSNKGSKIDREPPHFIIKRTRPSSGCEIIASRHFPPEAQGNFLINNVIGDRSVLQHTMSDALSGFEGKEITPLVYCEDGNFRPVDLQMGPDGALYVCDWHKVLIGHLQHNLRDPNRDASHGRIWRITYKGRPLVNKVAIAEQPLPELLQLLDSPEDRTLYRARRELAGRDSDTVLAAVKNWVSAMGPTSDANVRLKLEALWQYQTHNVIHTELLRELLACKEPKARAAATRVLCYWRDRVEEAPKLLRERLNDPHPRVRIEAVRAASFFSGDAIQEAVLDVLNHPMDPFLEYTLDETVRHLESK